MQNKKAHILIVDDDDEIRMPLAKFITKNGLRCSTATDGREMDKVLTSARIDLIVLDVMMPFEDGFSICRRIRENHNIPIILLTALTEEIDRIIGLELGADDYLAKPFNPRELLARIKSVLRRSWMFPPQKNKPQGTAHFDQWTFDLSQKEVVNEEGIAIRLSSGEHMLLISLIEHAGMTLSREQLLELTKGRDTQLFDRSIDNQVSRLRRKLELEANSPRIIQTEWGGGYQFAAKIEWSKS